jgi:hypothetical protein
LIKDLATETTSASSTVGGTLTSAAYSPFTPISTSSLRISVARKRVREYFEAKGVGKSKL